MTTDNPVLACSKAIVLAALERARSQHIAKGVKRDRCALDCICGAAIAFRALEGDESEQVKHLTGLAFLTSIRGEQFLIEFTKDKPT